MLKIFAALFGILFLSAALIVGSSVFGAMSAGNRAEQGIRASLDENKNMASAYSTSIAEAAQIPAMQRDDLTEVVTKALDARYGEDGSRAMFQFIKEQNPTIDSSVYTKLQQMIQAGRADFKASQDQRIDRCRAYRTELSSPWNGLWLRVVGYPKFDLDKSCQVVVVGDVQQIFETGTDRVIQLR